MRFILALAAFGLLGACNQVQSLRTDISAPPPDTDSEEAVLIAALRDAYDCSKKEIAKKGSPSCTGYKPFVISSRVFDGKVYYANIDPKTNTANASFTQAEIPVSMELILRFTNAGMTLSDLYCDRFFRAANQSSRKRRFTRNLSNDVGGAIATALGLAKVASGVVGGIAGGFAFADSSFRNYDESFMVDADLSKMRRLVLSAQDNMKLEIRDKPPETIFGAQSKIIRYAGLCSFLGMQDLLNESVAEKTKVIEGKNDALTAAGTNSQGDSKQDGGRAKDPQAAGSSVTKQEQPVKAPGSSDDPGVKREAEPGAPVSPAPAPG